jgi:NOL1/NOP2/fmu family ribosome biogenesis protein/23S rRNA U2552 (ribose-2'-O)-methylase RlmE/FtsJ
MAVAEILAPEPGERVLDLSAAPGGKATHLAGLMQNQGLLVANEIHPKRVWELVENLERWGTQNAIITQETPKRLAEHFGTFFDRVLLDAPCSGEGMFRKNSTAMLEWSLENVKSCAVRQNLILEDACRLVRPGGWLVYSTCTFNPYENEAVIGGFLEKHPEFSLESIPPHGMGTLPGLSKGKPEWVGFDSTLERYPAKSYRLDSEVLFRLARTIRFWPHLSSSEGHFIALMRKSEGSATVEPHHPKPVTKTRSRAWKTALDCWRQFFLNILPNGEYLFDPDRLALAGDHLYSIPDRLLGSSLIHDLAGLKVIRSGWWLGTIKSGYSEAGKLSPTHKTISSTRFEPSHALALALQSQDALLRVDFSLSSPEMTAYLHGESLPLPGEIGWVLVCVDGFPLGWARRSSNNLLKNHYPHHLRLTFTHNPQDRMVRSGDEPKWI